MLNVQRVCILEFLCRRRRLNSRFRCKADLTTSNLKRYHKFLYMTLQSSNLVHFNWFIRRIFFPHVHSIFFPFKFLYNQLLFSHISLGNTFLVSNVFLMVVWYEVFLWGAYLSQTTSNRKHISPFLNKVFFISLLWLVALTGLRPAVRDRGRATESPVMPTPTWMAQGTFWPLWWDRFKPFS